MLESLNRCGYFLFECIDLSAYEKTAIGSLAKDTMLPFLRRDPTYSVKIDAGPSGSGDPGDTCCLIGHLSHPLSNLFIQLMASHQRRLSGSLWNISLPCNHGRVSHTQRLILHPQD